MTWFDMILYTPKKPFKEKGAHKFLTPDGLDSKT